MSKYDRTVSTDEEITAEINDAEVSITFTRTSKCSRENYGADADGNRGEMRTEIEDEYTSVVVDGKPIKECDNVLQAAVETAIEEWMKENDPNIGDDDRGGEPEDLEDR